MDKPIALEVKPGTNSGRPYPDGSGCPSVVTVRLGRQLLRYAVDFQLEAKATLISDPAHMTGDLYRQSAEAARQMYTEWLSKQVSGQWFDQNREMYS